MWRRKDKKPSPAVRDARDERERSEASEAEALGIIQDFKRIRERNHMAEALRSLVSEGLPDGPD